MKINVTKRAVKSVLIEHAGSFLTVKEIEASLNLEGDKVMRKISGYLSRLRRDADIERKRNSIAFKYCFKKSAVENAYSEAPPDKKAAENSDDFNGFSFIESLDDATEGFCELCGVKKKLSYKAEKSNRWVFVCKECGERIKRQSGVFEWGR